MDRDIAGGRLAGTIGVAEAAARLGITPRHVRRACALYRTRWDADPDADHTPQSGELACQWFQRGQYTGYLVIESGLDAFDGRLNRGDTGQRGRRAGVKLPRKKE